MNKVKDQKHGVPALMSFFIIGLGQAVKGQWGKALGFFFGFVLLFMFFSVSLVTMNMSGVTFLIIISMIITWVYNIYDAYNSN